ncbi:MAG: hypothetical protein AAGB18_04505 [Pseudomonadota bacterium]
MSGALPEHYFRIRENGAAVFRVDTQNRERRLDLIQIAVVHLKKGEIRPHGDHVLSDADETAIRTWMAERRRLQDDRAVDDILRTVDHLNLTAQWAQSQASDSELDSVTDRLLLAMHDLRTVLVRKKADRLSAG